MINGIVLSFITHLIFFITVVLLPSRHTGKIIVALNLFISFCALLIYTLPIQLGDLIIDFNSLSIFSFVFIFLNFFLHYLPFLKKTSFAYRKFNFSFSIFSHFLSFIFIMFSLYFVFSYFPDVIDLIIEGDWSGNYAVREIPVKNILDWLIGNLISYLKIFSFTLAFYYLRFNKFKFLAIFMICLNLVYIVFWSILISSRGAILNTSILILILYYYFLSDKKYTFIVMIKVIFGGSFLIVLYYVIQVTVDRFTGPGSWYNNPFISIIAYIGQPQIIFSFGVYSMSSHSYGLFLFNGILNLFGNFPFNQLDYGGSWTTGFFTMVGAYFIDFGFIGSIILSIIFYLFTSKLLNSRNLRFSSVFLIFVIINYLIEGSFVIGSSFTIFLVIQAVLYSFLLFSEVNPTLKRLSKV